MPEELVQPKKSVWDFLDNLLPSATAVYGRIREQKTGVNPFGTSKTEDNKDDLNLDYPSGYDPTGGFTNDGKKKNTLWLVIGGVALIGLGVGTYFFIKNKKP